MVTAGSTLTMQFHCDTWQIRTVRIHLWTSFQLRRPPRIFNSSPSDRQNHFFAPLSSLTQKDTRKDLPIICTCAGASAIEPAVFLE